MKKLLFLPVVLALIFMGCKDKRLSENEMPWYDGTFAEAQENAGSQQIMIFFKTEW
ncbi:MAG: hypothetical protein K9N46_09930 [Candidatus Marinimicrobia bacterium]|nr:hypothetical protein [Candidatus Neomarinimicrobiota bacterium]MCF7828365.1 hypothetical protein [Candidatus Neomarinimicrobiota bacterium]MCF7881042.1 hypothetical protein [Candidatus Neomarinimicrobiota bacterium]